MIRTIGGTFRCWTAVIALASSLIVLVGCGRVESTQGSQTSGYPAVAPTITSQPTSQNILAGGSAQFTVVATGSTPLTYHWYKKDVGDSAPSLIPTATGSTYTYTNAQVADSGAQISVVVANTVGSADSSAATLTVTAVAPQIAQQPQSQSVLVGATATFSVVAVGTAPLSFQWTKNGVAIAGATSASYVTPATSFTDSGSQFAVTVSNFVGSVTSNTATLTVQPPPPTPPSIVTQPASVTVPVGGSATFSVTASGTAPLAYQWQVGGVNIAGATAASYTIASATAQQNQTSYTVIVSNAAGTVTSQPATLTVTLPPARLDLIAGQLGGAGNINGVGTGARFDIPSTLAVDAAGNVYVADQYNSAIREISPAGTVTVLAGALGNPGYADGVGDTARFNYPQGITVDTAGNVYVADTLNQVIRKITPDGTVTTLAGQVGIVGAANGAGNAAQFTYPQGLATDAAGNIYVADSGNDLIRVITPAGVVSTLAGTADVPGANDGTGTAAKFDHPDAVAVDGAGNVYVADTYNGTIRAITAAGVVTTLAGTAGNFGWVNGTGPAAKFDHPQGISVDLNGNLFVADTYSETLRLVTPAGVVTTIAGSPYATGSADGTGPAARFFALQGLAFDAADNLYIADSGNDTVRTVSPQFAVTTMAGLAPSPGTLDGTGAAAQFKAPTAAATDAAGNMYITDTGNDTIRKISPTDAVTTLAGSAGNAGSTDGTGAAALFSAPQGIAVDGAANVFVADTANSTIRMITPAGVVSTIAGTPGVQGAVDGTGAAARFNQPTGIVVDQGGNVYVADTGNNTIRMIAPGGIVTTLAGTAGVAGANNGTGAAARFNGPVGLTIDPAGNLYVADTLNFTIRAITPAGVVTTVAGTAGAIGDANGTGAAARFAGPTGIAIDTAGNLYVIDSYDRLLRMITPAGTVSTVAGVPLSVGVRLGPLPGSFNTPIGLGILPGAGVNLVIPDKGENSVLLAVLD